MNYPLDPGSGPTSADLLHWRTQQVRAALRRANASVTTLPAGLGYDSDISFGAAFERVFGPSPEGCGSARLRKR